ncbi:MAG: hypothetical protein H8D67_10580 [Deltaproteobacteria bacterium]|nr:hypothetical protein [Deltaproteobacteria bacterium]
MCTPLSPIELCKADLSMLMIMGFYIMAGMVMIVWPMFTSVFMVVCVSFATMNVFVNMLVEMVMRVGVSMLVAVLHVAVRMFMSMSLFVFMRVHVFVFMSSFHNYTSSLNMKYISHIRKS